jgi:predicted secreted protein
MIVCDLLAAFMALLWLKPLAARTVRESGQRALAGESTAPMKAKVQGVA